MKLSPRSYAILWDAHAWAGVLSSIVIFALFFLGAFALFAEELAPWQEPRFRDPVTVSDARVLGLAQAELEARLPEKPAWFGVSLPTAEAPWLRLWSLAPDGSESSTWIHPGSGERLGTRSDLGDFLIALHFLEPLPGGREVAGLASVVLLLLVGTGLLLQLGRMVRELVQFRPQKQSRVFWSDAHKVVGVISSPFVLVFALTGAVLCFGSWLGPALIAASFDGDAKVFERAGSWQASPPPKGEPGRAPDLAAALRTARERFPDAEHLRFFVSNLGDASASLDTLGEREMHFAAHTDVRTDLDGRVLWVRDGTDDTIYTRTVELLYGMHFAGWAGPWTRAVYALLSLLVAFAVLAGNLLWLERRRASGAGRFDAVLSRLTSGCCAGLALAVGALLIANQLLPPLLSDRPRWEHAAFFAAWAAATAYALADPAPSRSARRLLIGAAALLAAVLLVDAARSGRLPFASGSAYVTATEAGLVLLGALLAGAAHAIRRVDETCEAHEAALT